VWLVVYWPVCSWHDCLLPKGWVTLHICHTLWDVTHFDIFWNKSQICMSKANGGWETSSKSGHKNTLKSFSVMPTKISLCIIVAQLLCFLKESFWSPLFHTIYLYVYKCVCVCVCMWARTCTYIHKYIRTYVRVCVCVYIHMCVCMYVNVWVYLCMF
jgi:hypothetical protein